MAITHPPSANAGGHPVHGLLAAYPIACFTGAFLTDIAYAETYDMQWANFSAWLIVVGCIMGVLAAIAGIVDYALRRHAHTRRPGPIHTLGNLLVMVLSIINAFVHSRDAYTSVVPTGIILSGIVAVLVVVTAWIGNAVVLHARAGGAN